MFSISTETTSLGEPEAPVLVAEKPVGYEGQNHIESGAAQSGRRLNEGVGKNKPSEPLSM